MLWEVGWYLHQKKKKPLMPLYKKRVLSALGYLMNYCCTWQSFFDFYDFTAEYYCCCFSTKREKRNRKSCSIHFGKRENQEVQN